MTKLIAGLGNPGLEYVWSRHNAGWMAIDALTGRLGLGEPRSQFSGAFWPASILRGERVAWLKPETYMNHSGLSVGEAARYFGIEPEDVLIISDDTALPFGAARYRDGGSAGGQKGLASVIAALGTEAVPRLRIGVGSPPPRIAMRDWVLGKLSPEQREAWTDVAELVEEGVERWLSGEIGSGLTLRTKALAEELAREKEERAREKAAEKAAKMAAAREGADSDV